MVAAGACVREETTHKATGNVLFRQGSIDAAIAEYTKAIAANPDDAEAWILSGNALFERGDGAEAERAFRRALDLAPSARAARRGLAKLAMSRGDHASAEKHLAELLRLHPADAQGQREHGALLLGRGDLGGAEQALQRALTLDPQDAGTLYLQGRVQARRGRHRQALATCDAVARAAPGRAWADYCRAVAYAQQGSKDAALLSLGRAIERGIENADSVRSDEALASLRADPRFTALLARAHPAR